MPTPMTAQELLNRADDYRRFFNSPVGRKILNDLKSVCLADQTTFHENPYEAARRAGRREVWLRIQAMMQTTDQTIEALTEKEQSDG